MLVHTPYLRPHHDWKSAVSRAIAGRSWTSWQGPPGSTIWRAASGWSDFLTPQDIHDRYRVLDGAIYGLASHGRLTGAFKPANRSPDIPGLYLAGGAAHPGPGMPMVLMSGWIAADTLDRDRVVMRMRDHAILPVDAQ